MRAIVLGVLGLALVACAQTSEEIRASQQPRTAARRTTSFEREPHVKGSRLATDRVVKIDAAHAAEVEALGGVKLGVLTALVVQGSPSIRWTEESVWPGASVDAATLGATHARVVDVESQDPCSPDEPRSNCPYVVGKVTARYELWHLAQERWADLHESLRPKPLPQSAIRDVQPGNWVRPPTVVEIKN